MGKVMALFYGSVLLVSSASRRAACRGAARYGARLAWVCPRAAKGFLTLQDAEAKADEFSVAAAEVSNLTIAAEPAGLTIDVAVTVAVAFPDDMAFKVLLAERVAVITYVDDLVQLPIGSLTIGAVELTPGEVTPLTTAFHLHLRQDTFWGAGPASPFFSGIARRPTARRASGPSAPI
ncbi:hypothetical protein JL722_4025 [Aureococcus anophagefferens]|nr:hypothetical protein JL722_4025 [Aureococcus anophagefferens]